MKSGLRMNNTDCDRLEFKGGPSILDTDRRKRTAGQV
jgi:hypothetical protein